jgi:hypothetical protein
MCSALTSFSEYIHIWYPVFKVGFSEKYFRIISGPLIPSTESSLVLLVAAIGVLCQSDGLETNEFEPAETPFVEAALSSMPIILAELSLSSVQCVVLLSIYYCCLLKPCHAHDFALIASFKIQNLLKRLVAPLHTSAPSLRIVQ